MAPPDGPIYPRWVGYVCLGSAISYLPAVVMVFFHSGPFAWTGLIALYIPASMFLGWMCVITYYTWRGVRVQVPA
jgi:hypothetical protein